MKYKRTKDNARNARLARRAMDETTDCGSPLEDVTDMLANLMHYCAQRRVNFGSALRAARGHFDAEAAGEE